MKLTSTQVINEKKNKNNLKIPWQFYLTVKVALKSKCRFKFWLCVSLDKDFQFFQ